MPEGEEVKSLILLTCDSVCDVMWLELGTRFREISTCPQKTTTWAFLKAHTSTKHLLRDYAKLVFKHGKNMRNLIIIDLVSASHEAQS